MTTGGTNDFLLFGKTEMAARKDSGKMRTRRFH